MDKKKFIEALDKVSEAMENKPERKNIDICDMTLRERTDFIKKKIKNVINEFEGLTISEALSLLEDAKLVIIHKSFEDFEEWKK